VDPPERWKVPDRLGEALQTAARWSPGFTVDPCARGDVLEYKERLARRGISQVVGTLAASDVQATLATADVLVHVESFDEDIARFTRLSLSTKLPEYLASGRPLLGIGPQALASMKYIRECGAGLVVTEPGADAMMATVGRLARDPGLRAALGQAGWNAARTRHDDTRKGSDFEPR
jgi:glycosyltransferase involved in cell wall biosynthesis